MAEDQKRQGKPSASPVQDSDAFWLTDLYPDARALFEHDQVPLSQAADNCMVVLDASTLLFPFEFSSASISEVERVYALLAEARRLIVPGQAAREFYKNRSNKITAIADALDGAAQKAKKQIFEKSIPLLEDDADYQAAKAISAEIVNKGKEIAAKLSAVSDRLKDDLGNDRVSSLYRKLFGDCICDLSLGKDDRTNIVEEVARRARLQIAPGYKDQNKDDGGIGDYLIWRTILEQGAKRKINCIFVTEEEKADWWIKRQGTFQPRPELIEEFRQSSGGKSFHLVPLSGLLAAFKADRQVVQQVQELEEVKKRSIRHLSSIDLKKSRQFFADYAEAEQAKVREANLTEELAILSARARQLSKLLAENPNEVGTRQARRDLAALNEMIDGVQSELASIQAEAANREYHRTLLGAVPRFDDPNRALYEQVKHFVSKSLEED